MKQKHKAAYAKKIKDNTFRDLVNPVAKGWIVLSTIAGICTLYEKKLTREMHDIIN